MDHWTGWEERQFGGAGLGDKRRTKRPIAMAGRIARQAGDSLPKQFGGTGRALTAAYRFRSNPAIKPPAVQSAHRPAVVAECRQHPVIPCVQDTTELDIAGRRATDLGKIGDGRGQGFAQHTAPAVAPGQGVLGILKQDINRRQLGHDHVVRAMLDRKARADQRPWDRLGEQPTGYTEERTVPARPTGQRHPHGHRTARLTVRQAPVTIPAPVNDPRDRDCAPIPLWAVQVGEESPPPGFEPVEGMLLRSPPARPAK